MNQDASNGEQYPIGKEPPQQAPCQEACPMHTNIPRFLRRVAERNFTEAIAVIRETNPFPSICGRVCFNQCELNCPMTEEFGAPMIRAVELFAAKQDPGAWKAKIKAAEPTGRKVAVVGAGPAGLTAAYHLTRLGHHVTVFEALPYAGGMLRVGIPQYRLPVSVVEQEIQTIVELGVDIRLNNRITNLDELLAQGFDAALLAVGTHEGSKLSIPGSELTEVLVGTEFLKSVAASDGTRKTVKKQITGNHVLVLGGGNAAMDCARAAIRLGASKAEVACVESREEMRAHISEIEEGQEEGITIHNNLSPKRIIEKDGHVAGIETLRVTCMEFDQDDCLYLETEEASEQILPCDVVIFAIGQRPDLTFLSKGSRIDVTRRLTIESDPATYATARAGVFAAGDAATTKPAWLSYAIAAGRESAASIDTYLGGTGDISQKLGEADDEIATLDREAVDIERRPLALLPLKQRLTGFDEVEIGLDEQAAVEQAKRCLRCDRPITINTAPCSGCHLCALACSFFTGGEDMFNLSKARIKISRKEYQNDFLVELLPECINCGLCTKYCNYNVLVRA